jgi:hypothetical protein
VERLVGSDWLPSLTCLACDGKTGRESELSEGCHQLANVSRPVGVSLPCRNIELTEPHERCKR